MIKLIKLSEYFEIKYGVNLEFQNMKICKKGIPFVSRTERNNGITGFVERIDDIIPNPRNTISVACGGSIMESFLQKNDYYSGRDLFYLKPKIALTDNEMLFYCTCLRANKYRYSYGRQANRTLAKIKIPSKDSIPKFVYNQHCLKKPDDKKFHDKQIRLDDRTWEYFNLGDLFGLTRGKEIMNSLEDGEIPLISASEKNNGLTKLVKDGNKLFSKSITIANNGSIGVSFYQELSFYATSDVTILNNENVNKYIGLFISTLIAKERYRFNYGRKWSNKKMQIVKIKLPATLQGLPDWEYMENYIKSLPYSSSL